MGKCVLIYWKCPGRMIPVGEMYPDLIKISGGMISVGEMRPDLLEMSGRDDSQRRNAS